MDRSIVGSNGLIKFIVEIGAIIGTIFGVNRGFIEAKALGFVIDINLIEKGMIVSVVFLLIAMSVYI